jgi:hypothetical protein
MQSTIERREARTKSSASPVNKVAFELPAFLWERVREKAYELWQQGLPRRERLAELARCGTNRDGNR